LRKVARSANEGASRFGVRKVFRITIRSWELQGTKRVLAIATTLALTAPAAQAVTIDVLWTGGSAS